MPKSLAERVLRNLHGLSVREIAALEYDWGFWSRPEQRMPSGVQWSTWLLLAGRGFGKTRAGAEAVRELVESGKVERIALVGPTIRDVRETMIDGESGLRAIFPDGQRPRYIPSRARLEFHNGAIAPVYSSEEPDRLRGPQHGAAWCDELAAWKHLEQTWADLNMGLRLGTSPKKIITTTPRPIPLIRRLAIEAERPGSGVIATRGKTLDNSGNLPDEFLREITDQYAGTRLGRQELDGEILGDLEGALFNRAWFRYLPQAPELSRTVVAVDPAITLRNDETGIVVTGRAGRHAYVVEDLSGKMSPDEWARRTVQAWQRHRATAIVAEVNRGALMVETLIRQAAKEMGVAPDRMPRIVEVRATTGKDTRAEPVAALYEQQRVFHIGKLEKLEDQLCSWDPTSQDAMRLRRQATSPDRMDALVWGLTELRMHIDLTPDDSRLERIRSTRR